MLRGLDIQIFDLPDGRDPADLTEEELKFLKVLPVEKWMEKYDAAKDEDDKEISDDPDEKGEQQDGIPEDFRIKSGWIEYVAREERKNGKLLRTWEGLCSELHVVASVRGFSSTDWGMQLRFKDREGNPHEWVMPAELMAGVLYTMPGGSLVGTMPAGSTWCVRRRVLEAPPPSSWPSSRSSSRRSPPAPAASRACAHMLTTC